MEKCFFLTYFLIGEPEAGGRNFQGISAMEEDPDESILLSISRPIT